MASFLDRLRSIFGEKKKRKQPQRSTFGDKLRRGLLEAGAAVQKPTESIIRKGIIKPVKRSTFAASLQEKIPEPVRTPRKVRKTASTFRRTLEEGMGEEKPSFKSKITRVGLEAIAPIQKKTEETIRRRTPKSIIETVEKDVYRPIKEAAKERAKAKTPKQLLKRLPKIGAKATEAAAGAVFSPFAAFTREAKTQAKQRVSKEYGDIIGELVGLIPAFATGQAEAKLIMKSPQILKILGRLSPKARLIVTKGLQEGLAFASANAKVTPGDIKKRMNAAIEGFVLGVPFGVGAGVAGPILKKAPSVLQVPGTKKFVRLSKEQFGKLFDEPAHKFVYHLTSVEAPIIKKGEEIGIKELKKIAPEAYNELKKATPSLLTKFKAARPDVKTIAKRGAVMGGAAVGLTGVEQLVRDRKLDLKELATSTVTTLPFAFFGGMKLVKGKFVGEALKKAELEAKETALKLESKFQIAVEAGAEKEVKRLLGQFKVFNERAEKFGVKTKIRAEADLRAEVGKVTEAAQAELAPKTVTAGLEERFGVYAKDVREMQQYIRLQGERVSKKTRLLGREHVPRRGNKPSSDELASDLGFESGGALLEAIMPESMGGVARTTKKSFVGGLVKSVRQKAREKFPKAYQTFKASQVGAKRQIENIFRKKVPAFTSKEDVLLRQKLRVEARGAKRAFVVGGKEARETTMARVKVSRERAKLRKQLAREISLPKVKKQFGVPRSRLGADTQQFVDDVKKVKGMSKSEAQTKIYSNIEQYVSSGKAVPDDILKQNEVLSFAGIEEMTNQELRLAVDKIRVIKAGGRDAVTKTIEANRKRADETSKRLVETITGGKGLKAGAVSAPIKEPQRGVLGALDKFDSWQHGWDTFLRRLSVKDKTTKGFNSALNKFGNLAHRSRITQLRGTKEIYKQTQTKYAELTGLKGNALRKFTQEASKPKVIGKFKNLDGVEVELKLSQNQAYKKYLEMKDPTLEKTFTEGMKWTDEIKEAVEKFLDPKTKKWADWQINEFYPKYYETVNKVFRELYGVNLPFNQRYTPIIRDVNSLIPGEMTMLQQAKEYASVTSRSLKERVKNIQPLEFTDGDQIFIRHVNEMEHFKAWASTIKEFRRVFDKPDLRKAIKQNHGEGHLKILDNFIGDMARDGTDKALAINMLDIARVNFTRSALGLNVSVFFKQLGSIPAYMTEAPSSAVIKGWGSYWKNPIKNFRTLMDSDMMKARYDIGFERDIKFAMAQDTKKALTGKEGLLNRFMITTRLGDRMAIIQGGWGVYEYNLNKLIKSGLSKEVAHKKALVRFERATQRTQQAGFVEDLGQWQRSGSFGKLFTMFQTAPNAYYRIASTAVRELAAGRGDRATHVKNLAIAWVVLPSIFQWISDGFEFREKRQARAVLLGPANGVLAFGNMLETIAAAVTGDDVFDDTGPSPFTTVKNLATAIQQIRKGVTEGVDEIDLARTVDNMASAVGQVTGVPLRTIFRTGQTGVGIAKGEITDPRRLIFSRYALEDVGEVSRLRETGQERSKEEYKLASTILKEVKAASTPDEKKAILKQYIEDNTLTESVMNKIKTLVLDKAAGVGSLERSLRSLPVKERAQYVIGEIKKVESVDEKRALLKRFIEQKILTESVFEEMSKPAVEEIPKSSNLLEQFRNLPLVP